MSKDYSNTKHSFPVFEGIFEKKHVENIGPALWLFLWFIARETGEGLVLGGKPIKAEEIDLPFSERTIRQWIKRLRDRGYIRTKQAPQGLIFAGHKGERHKSAGKCRDVQKSVNQDSERAAEMCQSERHKSADLNKDTNMSLQKSLSTKLNEKQEQIQGGNGNGRSLLEKITSGIRDEPSPTIYSDCDPWDSTEVEHEKFKSMFEKEFGQCLDNCDVGRFFNLKNDPIKANRMKDRCLYHGKSWYHLLIQNGFRAIREKAKLEKVLNPAGFLYLGVFGNRKAEDKSPYLLMEKQGGF